jgi:hypothetical protein
MPGNDPITNFVNSLVNDLENLPVNKFGKGLQALYPTKWYSNPPPDDRLKPKFHAKGLRQGIIQQTDAWANSNKQPSPYRLNFIYNPSDIEVGYSIDPSVLPSTMLTEAQAAATAFYPGMTTVSFALLFDRTYECWDGGLHGGKAGSSIYSRLGVYADIGAFERLTGSSMADGRQNNMLAIPQIMIFGGGTLHPGLSYVGFINSGQVSYTHFSRHMVPVRAALQVSATILIGNTVGSALTDSTASNAGLDDTQWVPSASTDVPTDSSTGS